MRSLGFALSPGFALSLPLAGFLLAGCAGSFDPALSGPEPLGGTMTIRGAAYGGQQPIAGAHIYLYRAGTQAFAGPGLAAVDSPAAAANAAVSLLQAATGSNPVTTADSKGNRYVVTDATGRFELTGDYSACNANDQLYLYSIGGNPGGGTNAAAALMFALGACSHVQSLSFINMTEVSTVASAFVLAGFATDALHVSDDEAASGNTTAQTAATGMANAFKSAAMLVNVSSGTARSTITSGATGQGVATLPQKALNSLADIMAACINTAGPLATSDAAYPNACNTLFDNTKSLGDSGTTPADTVTAMINLAHHPGVVPNVHNLFALQPTLLTFSPALTAEPNDWTLTVTYSGGSFQNPNFLAVDANGAVWVSDLFSEALVELSPAGTFVSGDAGFSGGGLSNAYGVAIDPNGDVWVGSDGSPSTVSKYMTSDGSGFAHTANGFTNANLHTPEQVASDASGNIWLANNNGYVSEVSSTGSNVAVTQSATAANGEYPAGVAFDSNGTLWASNSVGAVTFAGGAYGTTYSAPSSQAGHVSPWFDAVDAGNNIWIADENNGLTKYSNNGTVLSGSGYVVAGGGSGTGPNDVSIDGAGNAWIANPFMTLANGDFEASISAFTNAGATITGATGYAGASETLQLGRGVAVDASGNVWATSLTNFDAKGDPLPGVVVEFVGAGVPVVVPLVSGLVYGKLGTRP